MTNENNINVLLLALALLGFGRFLLARSLRQWITIGDFAVFDIHVLKNRRLMCVTARCIIAMNSQLTSSSPSGVRIVSSSSHASKGSFSFAARDDINTVSEMRCTGKVLTRKLGH